MDELEFLILLPLLPLLFPSAGISGMHSYLLCGLCDTSRHTNQTVHSRQALLWTELHSQPLRVFITDWWIIVSK